MQVLRSVYAKPGAWMAGLSAKLTKDHHSVYFLSTSKLKLNQESCCHSEQLRHGTLDRSFFLES